MNKAGKREGRLYRVAREFLLSKSHLGITEEVLEQYLVPADKRPRKLNGIYLALLSSAQNAQRRSSVIGKSLGPTGIKKLAPILSDFNPKAVLNSYRSSNEIFSRIKREIRPESRMRNTSGGIWACYSKTILEGAEFLSRFATARAFYRFADPLAGCEDERVNLALPLLIDKTISGFGFALSCDFCRKLGYPQYAKPDVHIIAILKALGICRQDASAYEVSLALNRVARKAHETPYALDKVLWLIGSGKFHKHKDSIGKKGQLPRMRSEFISYAKKQLQS